MALLASPRRAFGYGVLAALAAMLLLGALFVLSGAYNVAASAKHLSLTDALFELALERSVDTYSGGIKVPDLDDPALIHLGARHFATGCEPCHGAPGIRQGPIAASMYPSAPPLGERVDDWEPEELFWIIRHGFKLTGMPHWPGEGRDDEVWPVVAFVRELRGMTAARYAELAGASGTREFAFAGEEDRGLTGCALCHGDADRAPISDLVPALQGQDGAYLLRALREYADGARESGMMEPVAAALSPEATERVAEAFAAMPLPAAGTASRDEERNQAGGEIASSGLPGNNVPPCLVCHAPHASPQFPALEGLSARYIENQLFLFRQGTRGDTAYGAIMATIAERLTDQQIRDVAAYFAVATPGEDGPAP